MIPKNIKRKHVVKAIEEAENDGIPEGRGSRKFLLEYNGKYYPPKYIVSLANKYANGRELDSSEFSGGNETNSFLIALRFKIVGKPFVEKFTSESPKEKEEGPHLKLLSTKHDERCPKCKETVGKLLERIYGKVEQNFKFEIGTYPEDFRNAPCHEKLVEIYEALQNHRGFKEFVKAKTLPNCDFFIPDPGFVVEFDESQHFTLPRKITFEHYLRELELGFDKKRWSMLCEEINAKDNDPPYRDEQRAWYDTLRDFLPAIKSLKPTVRLFARDFMWCDLNPDNPSDVKRFESILKGKFGGSENDHSQLKVVLCVPRRNQSNKDRSIWENEISNFAKNVAADLIILPEDYIECKFDDALSKVRDFANRMGFAVLSGVYTTEGYRLAVFCNPKPEAGETKEHIYIKHSTAPRLAYEWPHYKGKNDPMFDPIIFRGRKIGVMICHDMFFPLIPNTLVKHGAEILIDLTGGNVNLRKWNNIIRTRSLEIQEAFLCTMGYDPKDSGRSTCIAYENGKKVPFLIQSKSGGMVESLEGPKPPGFAAVTIPCHNTISEIEEQSFSNKIYSDIIFSFNKNSTADLEITKIDGEVRVSSREKVLHPNTDGWIKIEKRNKIIGLLVLPLDDILNRVLILKRKPKEPVDFHLVLYYGEKLPLRTNSDLMALAKLRAIENRVGILILTNVMREAIKTNNYKNIQRFKEKNGLFGFNEENLGGPESIFSQSKTGIHEKFKDKYLGLLSS